MTQNAETLKNVELFQGKCAICRGPISKDWAGEKPSLGTKCRACSYKQPELHVFGPENVEIHVNKQIVFDPLFGTYKYHFDWAGTRFMLNGRAAIVHHTQADLAWFNYEDDDSKHSFGNAVNDLGYWDVLRIYKETGGETNPPALNLPDYTPTAIKLLDEPIIPVTIEKDDNEHIRSVRLGEMFTHYPKLPMSSMFHAFCNTFVRFKFGLSQNLCCEGGFMGRNFEVRNSMSGFANSMVSIHLTHTGSHIEQWGVIENVEQLRAAVLTQTFINMDLDQEEERIRNDRSKVLVENPSPDLVMSTWAFLMETLMRYDWTKVQYKTIDDVWQCFCRMQDVLVNVIPADVCKEILNFAQNKRHVHYGQSF